MSSDSSSRAGRRSSMVLLSSALRAATVGASFSVLSGLPTSLPISRRHFAYCERASPLRMSMEDSGSKSFTSIRALTLAGAQRVMSAAVSEAEANEWKVTIVVTDAGGSPILLQRLDAAPATVEIASAKARSAALLRTETVALEVTVNGSEQQRPRLALLSNAAGLQLMEGGVPILIDGACVGAVGVSGVKAAQDAKVAKAGIKALLDHEQASQPQP